MSLSYDIVKEWATNNKVEVCELAQRFGGGFVCSLAQAFIRADRANTEKILNTWKAEFKDLYKISERERQLWDKAEANSHEELKHE